MYFYPRTTVVVMAAIQLSSISISLIPCPSWEDGVYLNGKCFKTFSNTGLDWYQARDACYSQPGKAKLAEPRTREECELTLSMTSRAAWIGAYSKSGESHRFVSDNATMEFFGFRDPWDPVGVTPSCIRTRGAPYIDMRDMRCDRASAVYFHICERHVAERYMLPSLVISTSPLSGVLEVSLDIVPNRDTVERQQVVLIYKGIYNTTMGNEYTMLDISNSSELKTFVFANVTQDSNGNNNNIHESIQLSGVEVVTSHTMTLTLRYSRDPPAIIRALLHPFLSELDGSTQETSTHYILASPSRHWKSFALSVISKSVEINRVNIIFKDVQNSDYVYVDSMYIYNPSNIAVVLKQCQSANIKGTTSLDGTEVVAAKEVSVFIIVFEGVPNDQNQTLILSHVRQALPFRIASDKYIVFLPSFSNETNYNLFTIISVYDETLVTMNDETHYFSTKGSSKEIRLGNNRPFVISSEKYFKMFKVFNGSIPFGITNDMCSTIIIPKLLWKTEYSIPNIWTQHVDKSNLYLVAHRNITDTFYLNDVITRLMCFNISGIDNHVGCTIDLLSVASSSPLIHVRSPIEFGAHLAWLSNHATGCQILGLNWYGDWLSSWPSSSHQSTNTTGSSEQIFTDEKTCDMAGLMARSNLTDEEIDHVLKNLHRHLHVEASKTSAFIRSKTSAKNVKPSSRGVGYGGVAFLVIALTAIVISDLITLCKPKESRRMEEGTKNNKQKRRRVI